MLCPSLMHFDRRLAAALLCAVQLAATRAVAQPSSPLEPPPPASAPSQLPPPSDASAAGPEGPVAPETLEAPYTDVPPPAAPLPPPPLAPGQRPVAVRPTGPVSADTRPALPIRARRRLALTGELSWNGLAGVGPILTYHVDPHFSLDLGGGLSLLGWKAGLRGRYNFLTSSFTPFLGLGFNAATGLGEVTVNPDQDTNPNRDPVTINMKPSYLLQGTLGFDFVHRRGFTLLGCIGYAWLLNRHNYDILAGELTAEEQKGFRIAFKGGPVISLATGYSFE